jgi:hypothetical protein
MAVFWRMVDVFLLDALILKTGVWHLIVYGIITSALINLVVI